MTARLLLYLSAHGATLAQAGWRGRLRWLQPLAAGAAGLREAGEIFGRFAQASVRVLVDSVEEDYRFETLPHTWGSARRQMVTRRLNQFYRATPYRTALFQGRESGRRRDDRFLFLALTRPELFEPWRALFQEHGVAVAGVHATALVHQRLADRLEFGSPHLLLVSRASGGLRQSYFFGRRLRLSRLTPLDASSGPQVTPYAAEIGKTRLYLSGQRHLGGDETLAVGLLGDEPAWAELAARLNADPGLACKLVPPARLKTLTGVSDPAGEALLLGLAARARPGGDLAPRPLRWEFLRQRLRVAFYAAAALTGLATLAWLVAFVTLQTRLSAQAGALEAQVKQQQALYVQARRQYPDAPAGALQLETAVEAVRALEAGTATPGRAFSVVSRALDAMPAVRLETLRWEQPEPALEADAGPAPAALSPESAAPGPAPAPAAGPTVTLAVTLSPYPRRMATVRAAIRELRGHLLRQPGVVEVSVVAAPQASGATSGRIGEDESTAPEPGVFELRVRLAE